MPRQLGSKEFGATFRIVGEARLVGSTGVDGSGLSIGTMRTVTTLVFMAWGLQTGISLAQALPRLVCCAPAQFR